MTWEQVPKCNANVLFILLWPTKEGALHHQRNWKTTLLRVMVKRIVSLWKKVDSWSCSQQNLLIDLSTQNYAFKPRESPTAESVWNKIWSPKYKLASTKNYHLLLLEEAGVSTPPLQVGFSMSQLIITWAVVSIDTHTSVSQLNHIQTRMQALVATAVNCFTTCLTGMAYLLSSRCSTGQGGSKTVIKNYLKDP